MGFTAKIILSGYAKEDGTHQVLLQAIMDRKRVALPLGFCLSPNDFDKKRQAVKSSNPNAQNFQDEFLMILAKAHTVASKMRQAGKPVTPSEFRSEFISPTDGMDVVKFIQHELELKRPVIAPNTYKQHNTLVNKLTEFRKVISFTEINIELLQAFRNKLVKDDNGPATVEKMMKILKQHLAEAKRKGVNFREVPLKIKQFRSNRLSLTQDEVDRLDKYYEGSSCPTQHKKLLRYFLFSCYTGLRISDIGKITWNQIHDGVLIFTPTKTKKDLRTVTVPLGPETKYLPEFKEGNSPIFDTFADQVSNRYLKDISKVEEVAIHKNMTYHTSRHTFGSLFAEGGNIVALQKMMGHGDIKTTMGYVHTSTKNLVDAKKQRFG